MQDCHHDKVLATRTPYTLLVYSIPILSYVCNVHGQCLEPPSHEIKLGWLMLVKTQTPPDVLPLSLSPSSPWPPRQCFVEQVVAALRGVKLLGALFLTGSDRWLGCERLHLSKVRVCACTCPIAPCMLLGVWQGLGGRAAPRLRGQRSV
jgi:hypothetical protein